MTPVDDMLLRWIREVVSSGILTTFEPEAGRMTARRTTYGRVRRAIDAAATARDGEPRRLQEPVGRHAFLIAAYHHLQHVDSHERLIMSFGKRRGVGRDRPSQIEGVWVGDGTANDVRPSVLATTIADNQIARVPCGEVIYVHNHIERFDRFLLEGMFGWRAVPSFKDRSNTVEAARQEWLAFVDWIRRGNTRFYLVEGGGLREFVLPPVDIVGMVLGLAR